jgi:branched-chain amino acid transport system permease protein
MAKKEQPRKVRDGDKAIRTGGDEIVDRDIIARQHFDAKQSEFLRTLVCDDVIEEHRIKPLGQHSEPLERLLLHFRRMPMTDKYAIKRDDAASAFRLFAISGQRGVAPLLVDDEEYATVEDAYHGIFLRQIKELMGS